MFQIRDFLRISRRHAENDAVINAILRLRECGCHISGKIFLPYTIQYRSAKRKHFQQKIGGIAISSPEVYPTPLWVEVMLLLLSLPFLYRRRQHLSMLPSGQYIQNILHRFSIIAANRCLRWSGRRDSSHKSKYRSFVTGANSSVSSASQHSQAADRRQRTEHTDRYPPPTRSGRSIQVHIGVSDNMGKDRPQEQRRQIQPLARGIHKRECYGASLSIIF